MTETVQSRAAKLLLLKAIKMALLCADISDVDAEYLLDVEPTVTNLLNCELSHPTLCLPDPPT